MERIVKSLGFDPKFIAYKEAKKLVKDNIDNLQKVDKIKLYKESDFECHYTNYLKLISFENLFKINENIFVDFYNKETKTIFKLITKYNKNFVIRKYYFDRNSVIDRDKVEIYVLNKYGYLSNLIGSAKIEFSKLGIFNYYYFNGSMANFNGKIFNSESKINGSKSSGYSLPNKGYDDARSYNKIIRAANKNLFDVNTTNIEKLLDIYLSAIYYKAIKTIDRIENYLIIELLSEKSTNKIKNKINYNLTCAKLIKEEMW